MSGRLGMLGGTYDPPHVGHLIVAQGPSANLDDLQRDIRGLPFEHPVPIGGAWAQLDCTTCHSHESGY